MTSYDVIVIGGGPAGLAAALAAKDNGASVLVVEREERLGGMLKQCIHDGFGLKTFGERLTGPEYVERFMDKVAQSDIDVSCRTFVTHAKKTGEGFAVTLVSGEGLRTVTAKSLVLATGCRERSAKQVLIHGTRPAGVFTAGTAQHFVNRLGVMPTKRCVILGSGDIGLIMARRLTLEGAQVLGVYEINPTPSGLSRNIYQCLTDYDIPLHLSHTVTRVYGRDRLEAVEVCAVNEDYEPIPETAERLECDALIVSVGLIPENELALSLGVEIDAHTGGPIVDAQLMTNVEGIFSCGNALHVNDLVDFVSESGEEAGRNAAGWSVAERREVSINIGAEFSYLVPQKLDLNRDNSKTVFYFRSKKVVGKSTLKLKLNGETVWQRTYPFLRPPEMQQITLDMTKFGINDDSDLRFEIEVVQ